MGASGMRRRLLPRGPVHMRSPSERALAVLAAGLRRRRRARPVATGNVTSAPSVCARRGQQQRVERRQRNAQKRTRYGARARARSADAAEAAEGRPAASGANGAAVVTERRVAADASSSASEESDSASPSKESGDGPREPRSQVDGSSPCGVARLRTEATESSSLQSSRGTPTRSTSSPRTRPRTNRPFLGHKRRRAVTKNVARTSTTHPVWSPPLQPRPHDRGLLHREGLQNVLYPKPAL